MPPHSTIDRGKWGEDVARAYLETKGLTYITANWWCKMGEIDLIMNDGKVLVFVEVRLRRPTSFGMGLETIAWQKQRKLLNTAKYYQQKENYWGDIRFDAVSIMHEEGGEPKIEHIEHAFTA